MRRALIVIGKAPEPGITKTRLVPFLAPEEAAALYRAFLLDAIEVGLSLGWERTSMVHPRGAEPALKAIVPRQIKLIEQGAGGLGSALAFAFEHHFEEGFERVVLIGSDNPTLPGGPIEQALAALDSHDVSIGPTSDGGYYLIGLRRPHLELFEAIDWSTSRVYAQTMARAQELGLQVHAVREWYDVDGPADLDRLHRELRSVPEVIARNTRAVLRLLGAATASGA
jgi:rSAM/selenodomain-associated transferase 1